MKNIFFILLIIIKTSNLFSQKEIVIGTQTWSAENLNLDKFSNGELIIEAKNAEDWYKSIELKSPAWCYPGFNVNNEEYKTKSESVWDKHRERISNSEMSECFSDNQSRKYCFSNSSGKYEITLSEDDSKKVVYKLYNNSGVLQKTMQGVWELRDEGVYGPTYKITISWTGANSSMPETKYVCQYSGDGTLQNLIDNQNRTWNPCY